MAESGLSQINEGDLTALLVQVESGALACPITKPGMVLRHLGHLWPHCSLLTGLSAAGASAVLRAVIAERCANHGPALSLVWTGPETPVAECRDTAIVVQERFEGARRYVLVGGYSFDHGANILKPLHQSMKDHGVQCDVFLDVQGRPSRASDASAFAQRQVNAFFNENWPFGPPRPQIYYDPRPLTHPTGPACTPSV